MTKRQKAIEICFDRSASADETCGAQWLAL